MTMSSNNLQGAPETTQTHTAGWLMTATSYNLQNSHGRVIRDYVVLQLTACSRNYSNSRGRPETTQTNMAGQLMTAASYNLQRAPETTQTHRATKKYTEIHKKIERLKVLVTTSLVITSSYNLQRHTRWHKNMVTLCLRLFLLVCLSVNSKSCGWSFVKLLRGELLWSLKI